MLLLCFFTSFPSNNAMTMIPMMPIRFFKIILKTSLQRLKLPNKFTGRYGGAMSNPVFLKPLDGTQWKVYWTKENVHEVWFQKGWKEFSENYSLDHGHLVLFTYDGTSQFDVIILDKSALEIDYPICNNCDDGEKNKLDHESEDESVQFLKDRQTAPSFSPRPHKRMRETDTGSQLQSTLFMSPPRRRNNAMLVPIRFFKIILKTNRERLKLPNKFTRRYRGGLSNPVFLKPPDETQWEVYWTEHSGGEVWFEKGWKEFSRNYFLDHGHLAVFKYKGNSQFDVFILDQSALEIDYPLCNNFGDDDEKHNLGDESVQILEEILPRKKARQKPVSSFSPPQPLLKMRGEKGTQRTSSLNWPKDPRAREVAQSFISYNPFFTMFIKPTYLADGRANVPSLEGYVENKVKYVKLQIEKKSWQVKMLQCRNLSSRRLSGGWKLFAQENELQPEDVCVFELINKKGSVFKVHVFKKRNIDDESEDDSVQMLEEFPPRKKARQKVPSSSPKRLKMMRGKKVTQRTLSLNWPKDRRAQEVARNFISYNPFFTVFIKPTHLTKYQVNAPSLNGYIENEVKDVMLQIGKRSWKVKMLSCHNPWSRRLSAGWKPFAAENGLQPEDVCVFELINRKGSVFKVHVFKKA